MGLLRQLNHPLREPQTQAKDFAMLLVIVGLVMLGFTWWDWRREETSAGILSTWLGWLNISREDTPLLYALILIVQAVASVVCIYLGLRPGA